MILTHAYDPSEQETFCKSVIATIALYMVSCGTMVIPIVRFFPLSSVVALVSVLLPDSRYTPPNPLPRLRKRAG